MLNKIIWTVIAVIAIILSDSCAEDIRRVVAGLCGCGLIILWAIEFFTEWGEHQGGIIRMTYIDNSTPRIAFVLISRILIIIGTIVAICNKW